MAAGAAVPQVVVMVVIRLAILVVPQFSAEAAVRARVPTREAPVEMVVLEAVVVAQLC